MLLLIVDPDLSFAFWLGRALDAAGYVSLPAHSIAAATELLAINASLDAVVIDAAMPEAAGFATRLRELFPGIKTIAAVPDDDSKIARLSAFDAHREKPRLRDSGAISGWVGFIEALSPPPRQSRATPG